MGIITGIMAPEGMPSGTTKDIPCTSMVFPGPNTFGTRTCMVVNPGGGRVLLLLMLFGDW